MEAFLVEDSRKKTHLLTVINAFKVEDSRRRKTHMLTAINDEMNTVDIVDREQVSAVNDNSDDQCNNISQFQRNFESPEYQIFKIYSPHSFMVHTLFCQRKP